MNERMDLFFFMKISPTTLGHCQQSIF